MAEYLEVLILFPAQTHDKETYSAISHDPGTILPAGGMTMPYKYNIKSQA